MFPKRISLFVLAASLALISLILFQVHWMYQSQKLIEAQFDQRVSMALCSAMDQLKDNPVLPAVLMVPNISNTKTSCSAPKLDLATLDRTVALAMDRYGIALDFSLKVSEDSSVLPFCRKTYCTPLDPLKLSPKMVHLDFEGKRAYVLQELGPMAAASVILLLFVSAFFVVALIKLWQQKKLYSESIDFFDNMAHEFRTPLANIQLALGIWKKRAPEIEKSRYHRVITQESQQLLEQVDRILAFSQLSQGAYPLNKESIDLGSFLHSEIALAQIWVAERGGTITLIESSQELPQLKLDPLHFRNVIRNLLDNALKYGGKGVQIEVRYGQIEQGVFFAIKDDGPGIAQRDFEKVSNKFSRLENGYQEAESGFGLGLYYVRKVVELHQGQIRLTKARHGGTEFQLILPA